MTHLCVGLAQEIDGISSQARIILTQRNNTPEIGIECWKGFFRWDRVLDTELGSADSAVGTEGWEWGGVIWGCDRWDRG